MGTGLDSSIINEDNNSLMLQILLHEMHNPKQMFIQNYMNHRDSHEGGVCLNVRHF